MQQWRLIRLRGCTGWSKSLRDAQVMLVLSFSGSFEFCVQGTPGLIFTWVACGLCTCQGGSEENCLPLTNQDCFPSIPNIAARQFNCLPWNKLSDSNWFVFRISCPKSFPMSLTNEPPHDKTNSMAVCPMKTQISLGIRPVWSESSLSAWRKLGSLATHWAYSKDSNQTGRMPQADLSLRWAHTHFVVFFSCRGWNQNCFLLNNITARNLTFYILLVSHAISSLTQTFVLRILCSKFIPLSVL